MSGSSGRGAISGSLPGRISGPGGGGTFGSWGGGISGPDGGLSGSDIDMASIHSFGARQPKTIW